MTSRVQTLRSSVAGARPAAGSQPPGELYVNWPDLQIGVIDSSKNPLDLIPVRFFSATSNYVAGDIVVESGHMWHANTDIPAGPFNPAQWDQNTVNPGPGGYLPLSGGTMTGALALAGDPTGPLQAATKEYVDLKLPLAGGTLTGDLVLYGSAPATAASAAPKSYVDAKTGNYLLLTGGTLAGPGNLNMNGALTVGNGATVTGGVASKGASAALLAYDRGNSGGNTANAAILYRDANVGRLWMAEAGDILTMATTGNATFAHALTVSGAFSANAGATVTGLLTVAGNTSWPIQISSPAGTYCGVIYSLAGQHQWLAGTFTDGSFHIYDNSSGDRIGITIGGEISHSTHTTMYGGLTLAQANTHYQLQIDATNTNYNAAIQFNTGGGDTWYCGPFSGNTFYIYNGTTGPKIAANQSQVVTYGQTILASGAGSQAIIGATGAFEINGALLVSPQASSYGAGGAITVYGVSAYSTNLKSRVDSTGAYLAYWTYGGTNVGSVTTDGGSTFYNTTCDAKFKTNVRPMSSEIDVGDIIDRLEPVSFEWTYEPQKDLAGKDMELPPRVGRGFIAQDLHKVLPDAVKPPPTGDVWGADYSKIVPYLVAELQALRKRMRELEAKL